MNEDTEETNETHHATCCLLDETFSSSLLSSKIADIPQKLKYETIIAPIFEYCFGTANTATPSFLISPSSYTIDQSKISILNLKIDLKRDETFINSHIFNLEYVKFEELATKLNLFHNRELVLKSIQFFWTTVLFQLSIFAFSNDREIIMTAVRNNVSGLKLASNELRNDFEIVKTAVQEFPFSIQSASKELQNNEEIVKIAVGIEGESIRFASDEMRSNKEIVMIALESNTNAYEFVLNEAKHYRDVIFKAFSKSVKCILRASDLYRKDQEFVTMILKINGMEALKYASDELRMDREIVIQAIQQNPHAINFACDELKKDREIVKMAVIKDGLCLQYVPIELKNDEEIVECAILSSVDSIHFVSERLRRDIGFIKKFIGKRGFKGVIPDGLKNDREIILESIKLNEKHFNILSDELKSDREFVLQAVTNNGLCIEYVHDKFTQDREIVLAAVTQNGFAIHFTKSFSNDRELFLTAAKTYKYSDFKLFFSNFYDLLSETLRNREFIIQLVKQSGTIFNCLPSIFKSDREIIMEAVKTNPSVVFAYGSSNKLLATDRAVAIRAVKVDGMVLGNMCYNHRNDREIVSFAVKQNKDALKFASFELRNDKEILDLLKIW